MTIGLKMNANTKCVTSSKKLMDSKNTFILNCEILLIYLNASLHYISIRFLSIVLFKTKCYIIIIATANAMF